MVRQIVIEAETPGDSRSMFRLRMDASPIADGLTAVQAHLLVGEILERIALPKPSERAALAAESDAVAQEAAGDSPRALPWRHRLQSRLLRHPPRPSRAADV
jgi:hypothetical protein